MNRLQVGAVIVFACWVRTISGFQASDLRRFSDKATWENATANIASVSFDGLGGSPDKGYPAGLTIKGVTFIAGKYGGGPYLYVRTSTPNFMFGPADSDLGCSPAVLPCGVSGSGITVTLPTGYTSFGLDLGSFWPIAGGVLVQFPDGQSFMIPPAPINQDFSDATSTFIGFTSATPFTSFSVHSAGLPIISAMWFGVTSPATTPFISSGGIGPIYGVPGTIQPGEWVTIFGNHLATTTQNWNGDFPTSLAGASVSINGKRAYLSYVGPGQINLQAPDDTALGPVPVVLTTPEGTVTSSVVLARSAPSFSLLDSTHVAGIILRSNGSGTYGGGTYDIVGPTGNALGYPTTAARAGDTVVLFGVGFGPTFPSLPAGQVFSGAIPTIDSARVIVGSSPAVVIDPSFCGLSSAGLYQINVTIPAGLSAGDLPVAAVISGTQTQPGAVLSVQ